MTKKKNVAEKFKTFFKNLDKDQKGQLYAMLAIIRGPDDEQESQKRLTSCKIRHLLGIVENSENGYFSRTYRRCPSTNSEPLDLEELKEVADKRGYDHFGVHVEDLIKALINAGIVKDDTA